MRMLRGVARTLSDGHSRPRIKGDIPVDTALSAALTAKLNAIPDGPLSCDPYSAYFAT